jgi:hypothetical protein
MGSLLLDGMFGGTWRIARSAGSATLTIEPFAPIGRAERAGIEEEAERLLGFEAPGAEARIVLLASTP